MACDVPGGCGHLHAVVPAAPADPAAVDCVECRAGRRLCPGPHRGDHVHADDPFCPYHVRRLIEAIGQVEELYIAAWHALEPGRSGSERVTASREAPLPLVAEADTTMRRLLDAVSWADDVAEAAGLSDPPVQGRDGVILSAACRILTAHVDTLLRLPARERAMVDPEDFLLSGAVYWVFPEVDGVGAALEILDAVGHARAWLGRPRGRDHLAGVACPECGRKSLYRDHGSDTRYCDGCGERWTKAMLDRWSAMRNEWERA